MNTRWRWRNHGSGWVISLLWEYLLCLMLDYLLGMPWNKTPSYGWMIVWERLGQQQKKYSKNDTVSGTQGERIHRVSVVCYYFLAGAAVAGAAGVNGAEIAGLAAGAVAFGFSV